MKKQKYKNKLETDVMEQVDYIENKGGGHASMEDILDEGKRVGDLDPKGHDPQNVVKGQNLPKEYHERQIKEYMEKTKKASGGRVPFFMGGRYKEGAALLREMMEFFAKGSKHGKKPSEYLRISNPKQFQKMLNDLSIYKKYHKGEGIMAPDMIKEMIKKTEGDRADIIEHIISSARNIKKSDDSIAVYKKKMVDEMVKKGADKNSAEMLADGMTKEVTKNIAVKDAPKITEEGLLELETIYKNMLMKGRKPNASGGLAYMLGE